MAGTSGTTGARLLIDALARAGATRIFSLSGNQILPVYDAALDAGIAVTDTRHESAAAHMADAWARLRDEPGICLVTAAPGHTNALTGVATAFFAESPVLWLSGGSEAAHLGMGGFQELDQTTIAGPVTKAAWRAERADEIPALVARAWQTMQEGRPGPVHLTLPADVLRETIAEAPAPPPGDAFQPRRRPPAAGSVARAVAILAEATRPLLLASPAVTRGAAEQRLRELNALTGIPWFPLESPRGLQDPVLQGRGAAVRRADAVLLLAPQDFVIGFARPEVFAPGCRLIQLAPDAAELASNAPIELGLVGDAEPALAALLEAAREHHWRTAGWRDEIEEMRQRAHARLAPEERSEAVPIHPLRLAAELRAVLPKGASMAQDGGEFGQWARWELGRDDYEVVVNGKFGSIGSAIPFAIGAKLARPDAPSVCCLGDGTFGFHAMEFDTAVRHGIPFVAVVGNDAAWSAERHRQLTLYGADRIVASDLLPTRYDGLARALGGYGELVEQPDEIRPALERALASGRPACVNVMIQGLPSPAALP
ncbi:MAG TPA: thiamine pyrophosphate-binding protein [Thermomicrobiaceae bacterium]|nr:thiamine pyrophosphate-binding protein [Thermomicrobiaceae bacterium]